MTKMPSLDSEKETGQAVPDKAVLMAGDDTTNIQPFFVNTAGKLVTTDDFTGADGHSNTISLLPSTASAFRKLAVSPFGLAPDGLWDRIRTLGNTAGAGLGVLAAAPWIPGASDVLTTRAVSAADSSVVATVITPTTGTKIRLISLSLKNISATAVSIEVYFGTGANIGSDIANAVTDVVLDLTDQPSIFLSWPDGGGPVGIVDEVLSFRTTADVTTSIVCVPVYREE